MPTAAVLLFEVKKREREIVELCEPGRIFSSMAAMMAPSSAPSLSDGQKYDRTRLKTLRPRVLPPGTYPATRCGAALYSSAALGGGKPAASSLSVAMRSASGTQATPSASAAASSASCAPMSGPLIAPVSASRTGWKRRL